MTRTVFYYSPGSFSFVPHVMLEEAGVHYERIRIMLSAGENRKPEFLAINPRGQVPVLVVDGKILTQIVAICQFIADQHPGKNLLPSDPWERVQYLSTLLYLNNTVHPAFIHIFRPVRFADGEAAQMEVKNKGLVNFCECLKEIDGLVSGKEFLYHQFTAVDAYALLVFRAAKGIDIDMDDYPEYTRYATGLTQQESVKRVIECNVKNYKR